MPSQACCWLAMGHRLSPFLSLSLRALVRSGICAPWTIVGERQEAVGEKGGAAEEQDRAQSLA